MNRLLQIVITLSCAALATSAYAKKDKRQGLNFGAGLRLLDSYDNNLANKNSSKSSEVTSKSTAVTPYLGYAFMDSFNIGISTLFETQSYEEDIENKDNNSRLQRTTDSELRNASFFARFLFAKFMYFEGGLGLYDRRSKITDEYTSDTSGGKFDGEREQYRQRGVGFGYHVGGGIETPLVNGFYFTCNYLLRSYVLRHKDGEDIGSKQANILKRELTFGIAHYVD